MTTYNDYLTAYRAATGDPAKQAALHRAHYAQAVTSQLIRDVVDYFGADAILSTTCPHLSEIPCSDGHVGRKCWDTLANIYTQRLSDLYARATGAQGTSLSDRVCILKEAALQYRIARAPF